MSIEQLLFLLILVALPLIERLLRAIRGPANESPADPDRTVPEPVASRSRLPRSPHDASDRASEGHRTELPLPALPRPPALPQTVRDAAPEQLRAADEKLRVRREDKRRPAAGLRTGHSERPLRPGRARRPIIESGDLRRAIVLMVVLGPCRARELKDSSQLG